ncbi:MAG: hypothetical protein L6243_04440 [Candidatus Altiarchaeales archaeon]|nr:hypothetical protein [Candidatus Altiarchaeota archaeon]MCG2782818.1 hypothetical protein [Candidatus Altiarchaeales archaeon]
MAHFPFDKLKFREIDGIPSLVIAIAQDFNSNEVLMVAFTNEEGIQKTIETGQRQNIIKESSTRKASGR